MRVCGNTIPSDVRITPYLVDRPTMKEVRLTEHVEKIDDDLYVYDEYVFHVEDNGDLETQIRRDLDGWLATGREREVKFGASAVYHLEESHDRELAELVEMIYEDDLGTIG